MNALARSFTCQTQARNANRKSLSENRKTETLQQNSRCPNENDGSWQEKSQTDPDLAHQSFVKDSDQMVFKAYGKREGWKAYSNDVIFSTHGNTNTNTSTPHTNARYTTWTLDSLRKPIRLHWSEWVALYPSLVWDPLRRCLLWVKIHRLLQCRHFYSATILRGCRSFPLSTFL